MRYKSWNWKKSLSDLQHTRVLEIIGSSDRPLSSTEIHNQVVNKYYPGNKQNTNIYEIVKDLYKPKQNKNQRPIIKGFLGIDYKEKYIKEIARLKERFGIEDDYQDDDNLDVKVRTFKNSNEEMEWTNAILKIGHMMNDRKYYRYSLNVRGFLLYLIGWHTHYKELVDIDNDNKHRKQEEIKKVYHVCKNLITREDTKKELNFLKYFEVFYEVYGERKFVNILMQIAEELHSQLTILTPEFMKYYFVRRCYDEIVSDIAVRDINIFKNWSSQRDKEDYSKLERSKIQVLKILIELEEDQLNRMKKDLKESII